MNKFPVLILCLLMFACQTNTVNTVEELFEADRKFSSMAEEKGYNKAFIEYAHPDAVLLRENSLPLEGKSAITELFKNADTKGIVFTWEPMAGNIAQSGELGYTYGIYQIQRDSINEKGTYVSIWKKNDKGDWKYVLDSGNQGTGE